MQEQWYWTAKKFILQFSFMGETHFPYQNSPPVDQGIWWWYKESEECQKIVQKVQKYFITDKWWSPVGTAHEGLLSAQHTWRNWFWAAELTLGRTTNFTMRKFKWLLMNGCKGISPTCHDGIFKFIPLWDKYISVHGDYVEKQWYFSVIN